MIHKLNNIKPIIGDDSPFITSFYRDVPDGFRIDDLNDDFLTDYIDDLDLFFSDYEIVGETYKRFYQNLKVTWDRKSEIVKKYADYDKDNIHYTFDTVNVHTVEISESGDNTNGNESTDTHIDTPIDNSDSTPSTVDTVESSDSGEYSRSIEQTDTVTLDDGDIHKINKLTDNYRSVLDVLIDVFKSCFVKIETYTY